MIAVMVDEGDDWENVEIPPDPDSSSSGSSSSSSSDEEVTTTTGTAAPKSEPLYEEQLHQSG